MSSKKHINIRVDKNFLSRNISRLIIVAESSLLVLKNMKLIDLLTSHSYTVLESSNANFNFITLIHNPHAPKLDLTNSHFPWPIRSFKRICPEIHIPDPSSL